jgi:hypothetical protein
MVDIYARMQGTASRLLGKFKQGTVTLVRTTPGEPDEDEPWTPTEGEVDEYTLSAVAKGVSEQYVDGTIILASDLEIVAAVAEVAPMMETDKIKVDGIVVTIIRKMQIPAAGTPVAYRLIVRG